MRHAIQRLTTGLAAAALILATPVDATGFAPQRSLTPLAVTTTTGPVSPQDGAAPRPPQANAAETGGGWSEVYCLGCVGVAGYALATGGTVMLPVLLANAEMVGTFGATCLYACRSLIKQMFT